MFHRQDQMEEREKKLAEAEQNMKVDPANNGFVFKVFFKGVK